MDGFARSIGGAIGGLFSNAAAAVGNAINTVFAQIERIIPGGALPIVVVSVVVLLIVLYIVRH